ncbi:MAG: TatD family hydrolase [Vulcanibacillus sp.]
MLIDTHAHLDDEKFDCDREQVIDNARINGIKTIINVGYNEKTILTTLDLIGKYDFIYGAIGWHPNHAHEINDKHYKWIEELTTHPKIIGIGEIGLDYYWDYAPKDIQQKVFIKQIQLAKRVGLPIIIHDREAHKDILDILKNENVDGIGGIMHSFSGSAEMALECIQMGFYISISGPITFKNAKKSVEVIEAVPLDRILLETDSPYLTPVPFRGKRNEPANLQYIAKKIADIKKIEFNDLKKITNQNVKKAFSKM